MILHTTNSATGRTYCGSPLDNTITIDEFIYSTTLTQPLCEECWSEVAKTIAPITNDSEVPF